MTELDIAKLIIQRREALKQIQNTADMLRHARGERKNTLEERLKTNRKRYNTINRQMEEFYANQP